MYKEAKPHVDKKQKAAFFCIEEDFIMGRSKGSLSTPTANEMSKEMEALGCKDSKYGIHYMRMIELLVCYRIAEEVCKNGKESVLENGVTVEIPLFGNLTIKPRQFHKVHRMSDEPSMHFDYTFSPSSGFKVDLLRIFSYENFDIADVFSTLYSDRLKEIYTRLRGNDIE